MQALVIALTLWKAGFVSEEEFIEWVDKQISESENLPSEYFDLSIYGPTTCLKWAEFEFPCRPKPLAFIEEFSLCATLNDLSLGTSIESFIEWASRRCMGEDLDLPEVQFSYLLDHLMNDCNDKPAAVRRFTEEMPRLFPRCQEISNSFLSQVGGLRVKGGCHANPQTRKPANPQTRKPVAPERRSANKLAPRL